MGKSGNLATSLSFQGTTVVTKNYPFGSETAYGAGAVLLGNKCLVFGGYSGSWEKHHINKYDFAHRKWSTVLPKNVHNTFGSIRLCFIMDDILYAYSWNRKDRDHVFMSLDLILMDEWVPAGKDTCAQTGFGSWGSYCEVRKEAVLFGGKLQGTGIHVYSVNRSSWYTPRVSGQPPEPRQHPVSCCKGQKIYLMGGLLLDARRTRVFDLRVLTMEGHRYSWSTPVTTGGTPLGRYLCTAVCVGDRIIVYGGYGALKSFDVYSIRQKRWYHGTSGPANEETGNIHFTCDLYGGNSNCASVVCDDKILMFGGSELLPRTPLEISPS